MRFMLFLADSFTSLLVLYHKLDCTFLRQFTHLFRSPRAVFHGPPNSDCSLKLEPFCFSCRDIFPTAYASKPCFLCASVFSQTFHFHHLMYMTNYSSSLNFRASYHNRCEEQQLISCLVSLWSLFILGSECFFFFFLRNEVSLLDIFL